MGYDYCDNLCDLLLTHTTALAAHQKFKLIGGVDLDETKRSLFESKFCQPFFTELDDALRQTGPAVVVVANPSEQHLQTIECALNYKTTEIVLCEKPMGGNLEQAEKIALLSQATAKQIFVNYNRRVDPRAHELKKKFQLLLKQGSVKGFCWYSKGLRVNGAHFIDLARYWFGDVLGVQPLSEPLSNKWNDVEIDFALIFSNCQIIFQSLWEERFTHYGFEFMHPEGRIRYDLCGSLISEERVIDDPVFPGYSIIGDKDKLILDGKSCSQLTVYDHLWLAWNSECNMLPNATDSLKTQQVLKKIEDLSKNG